jgi:hypothetical protein
VGQFADLIIPDRDYFACPEDEIADITADLTIVGGRVAFSAGDFAHIDAAPPPPRCPIGRRFARLAATAPGPMRTIPVAPSRRKKRPWRAAAATVVHSWP